MGYRGSHNRILWAHVPGKIQSPRQAQKKNDKSDRIKAFAGGSRPLHFQLGHERCTRCLCLEDAPAWRTSFDKLDKCVGSLAFVFGSRQFHFQHSHERFMQCNRLEDSPTREAAKIVNDYINMANDAPWQPDSQNKPLQERSLWSVVKPVYKSERETWNKDKSLS